MYSDKMIDSKIIGTVNIGNNSTIGANALVINNIMENCSAVEIPTHIIKKTQK